MAKPKTERIQIEVMTLIPLERARRRQMCEPYPFCQRDELEALGQKG